LYKLTASTFTMVDYPDAVTRAGVCEFGILQIILTQLPNILSVDTNAITKYTLAVVDMKPSSFNQIYTPRTVRNIHECGYTCTNVPPCQGFTFQASNGECILVSVLYSAATTPATQSGVEWMDRID
jgi:hypothetical protein